MASQRPAGAGAGARGRAKVYVQRLVQQSASIRPAAKSKSPGEATSPPAEKFSLFLLAGAAVSGADTLTVYPPVLLL